MELKNLEILIPLLVVLPLLSALIILLIKNYIIAWIIAVVVIIGDFLIAIYLFINVGLSDIRYNMGNFAPPLGIEYKIDTLSFAFLFLTIITGFFTILWGKNDCRQSVANKNYIFIALILLIYTGILGMSIANDLFNIFVFMEISSLATYTLIALSSKRQGILFAFNYLIIGTVTSTFYVFGIGILYQLFGTLNIDEMKIALLDSPLTPTLILAITFIATALMVKVGMFPVGIWLPKPYQLAPNVVTIFLAGISTNIYIYLFMRLVMMMLNNQNNFNLNYFFDFFLLLSCLSIIYSSCLALKQNSLKLVVSFSSLAQIGYIFIGLVIFKPATIGATMFFLLVYTILKIGLLMSIGNIMSLFGTDNATKLRGIAKYAPFSYFAFLFFAFSSAGLPATAGLWPKLLLLISVSQSEYWYLIIIMLIGMLLSFFYLWKPIKLMWINENNIQVLPLQHKTSWISNLVIAILIICSFALTLYPNFAIYYCNQLAYLFY